MPQGKRNKNRIQFTLEIPCNRRIPQTPGRISQVPFKQNKTEQQRYRTAIEGRLHLIFIRQEIYDTYNI